MTKTSSELANTSEDDPNNSYFSRMLMLAQMGLKIVPVLMEHETKGPGIIYSDGNGIRFEPFDETQEPLIVPWPDNPS